MNREGGVSMAPHPLDQPLITIHISRKLLFNNFPRFYTLWTVTWLVCLACHPTYRRAKDGAPAKIKVWIPSSKPFVCCLFFLFFHTFLIDIKKGYSTEVIAMCCSFIFKGVEPYSFVCTGDEATSFVTLTKETANIISGNDNVNLPGLSWNSESCHAYK